MKNLIILILVLSNYFQIGISQTFEPDWVLKTKKPFFSSPSVSDGIVYAGSLDSNLYAVDINSGNILWYFKTSGEIRSTALVENNQVYFISGDGYLYCLDTSGKLLWTFKTRGEKKYDFADYHRSSPVYYKNSLFFGSGDGNIYALNSENGELLWKYQTEDVVHSTPVVDDSNLYVGSFDGYFYALNINDGSMKWKYKTTGQKYFPKGEVQGSPAIYKNNIIFGARDYKVYALDKDNGSLIWEKTFVNGWVLSNSIYLDELIIAGADERIIACLDPVTGIEKWKRKMEFLIFGKPAFNENFLFIGTTIGKLHGLNLKTGEIIRTFSTEAYNQNKHKYFKKDDSYRDDIYSIIKSDEHFLEVEIELGGFFSSPVIYNEKLVVTSTDGNIYCFKIILE
ncbi:MAG: PQQ-like beta-propeller repeat protein [Ignavibacteriae bacterium]|nr:PQQ-like beta-propeller repeat protein [Ignavibacteriota bacterium]